MRKSRKKRQINGYGHKHQRKKGVSDELSNWVNEVVVCFTIGEERTMWYTESTSRFHPRMLMRGTKGPCMLWECLRANKWER